jgi:hypothetical protein
MQTGNSAIYLYRAGLQAEQEEAGLLGTQGSVDDAQQERLRCLADWRAARRRLLAAAGRMGKRALVK